MANIFTFPIETAFDSNGNPLSGAKLYFYLTGTSTPQDTFSDDALTTPRTNPVIADSAGRFPVIYLGTNDYKVILTTSADVTIWTVDPVHGVASGSSGAATVASGRKNAIINGDFDVWQRGTGFAAVAANSYSADRWKMAKVGAVVATIARSVDVPTLTQAGRVINYSLLHDITTADAAIAAGDFCHIEQIVEGYTWRYFAQVPLVLSFWVKAAKAGTHCVSLVNSGGDRSVVMEYVVSVADTWEFKQIAFPASPAAGTWDYTNGIGIEVRFALSAGSTFQAAAGSWQTGNFIATSAQVNETDNVVNNFRITGVQLEKGATSTDFEAVPFVDELERCQRYYTKTYDYASAPGAVSDAGTRYFRAFLASTLMHIQESFPARMRSAPTFTFYNPVTGTAGQIRNVSAATNPTATPSVVGESGFGQVTLGTSPTINDILYYHFAVEAEL